jgi:LPXTG-motif cell wall-anchored protein
MLWKVQGGRTAPGGPQTGGLAMLWTILIILIIIAVALFIFRNLGGRRA